MSDHYCIQKSRETPAYNCVAFAFEIDDRWWWPDKMLTCYWPSEVDREETVDAFLAAFETLGFVPTRQTQYSPMSPRIALFCKDGRPVHVCREVGADRWVSKLGRAEDVEHDLGGLPAECGYGSLHTILAKERM